ncbi:co-chaperone GroES [Pueribacillus theae]|uniref:Co-chaperonin GroES n=1 Tax=Pueribacillus theae TaxID=2171751 RepID=A0A2U1JTA7_9BACI|nr:co-chaperone GroES [Pueribacillus theae]PWA08436.1 co-chaperone GroES [Pueribacillus theae]
MIKPLGSRVVLKPLKEEEMTAGGIVIPDQSKEKPTKGKVVAVGKGRYQDKKIIPLQVKKDDTVIFSKYAGTEVKIGEEEYLILDEKDILAILEEAEQAAEKEMVLNG